MLSVYLRSPPSVLHCWRVPIRWNFLQPDFWTALHESDTVGIRLHDRASGEFRCLEVQKSKTERIVDRIVLQQGARYTRDPALGPPSQNMSSFPDPPIPPIPPILT